MRAIIIFIYLKILNKSAKKEGKMDKKMIGRWAFIAGLVLAVIIAIIGTGYDWTVYVLLVLGLIVGLLNISDKEVGPFLIAAIAFMLTFSALNEISSEIPLIADNLGTFFAMISTFIAPAAAVVAFKELFAKTKN